MSDNKWYNSTFASGLCVFLLCLGIGTCGMMWNIVKIVYVEEPIKIEKVNE